MTLAQLNGDIARIQAIPLLSVEEMEAFLLSIGWRKRWSEVKNQFLYDDWHWGVGVNRWLYSTHNSLAVAYRLTRFYSDLRDFRLGESPQPSTLETLPT